MSTLLWVCRKLVFGFLSIDGLLDLVKGDGRDSHYPDWISVKQTVERGRVPDVSLALRRVFLMGFSWPYQSNMIRVIRAFPIFWLFQSQNFLSNDLFFPTISFQRSLRSFAAPLSARLHCLWQVGDHILQVNGHAVTDVSDISEEIRRSGQFFGEGAERVARKTVGGVESGLWGLEAGFDSGVLVLQQLDK